MKTKNQITVKCPQCCELLKALGDLLYCYTDHHSQTGIEKDDTVGRIIMLNLALAHAWIVNEKVSNNEK